MFFKYAGFGGFIKIGCREIPVTGKTFKKIAEFEAYWLSLCLCWEKSLLSLLKESPKFATKEFLVRWMVSFRRSFYGKSPELKAKFARRSILALRFEAWQCCREHMTLEEIDDMFDQMTKQQVIKFAIDMDKKIEIASGGNHEIKITELLRLSTKSSGSNPDHTNESMIANLVKQKLIGSPMEILDLTPTQLSAMLTDPDKLEDDLALELMIPEGEPEAKRNLRYYEEAAEEFLSRLGIVPAANVDIQNAGTAS